jgi:uncharacterized protein YcsI (UPF0317 family)
MYRTNVATDGYGAFNGPVVVSMRPYKQEEVARVVALTARFPGAHGAPLHIGDPESLGVRDLTRPEFGDAPMLQEGDVAVFHYCGVTPQVVLEASRPSFAITHAPGHMLVLDAASEDLDTNASFPK